MEDRWCFDGKVNAQHPGNLSLLSAYTMLHTAKVGGKTRIFSTTIPILFGVFGVGSLVLACLIFANAGT